MQLIIKGVNLMIPFKIVYINIFWTFMVILLSYVPSVWAQEANENLQGQRKTSTAKVVSLLLY